MPYLLLVIGLLLILLAALWLGQKSEESVAEQYNGEEKPPLADGESAAILRLAEMVEGALAELDEKNRVLLKILNRYEEHRAAIEQRLELLNRLLEQTAQGSGGSSDKENPAFHISRQVYAMSDRGSSVVEIAAALGMGRGEVQLILSLRNLKN